MSIAYKIADWWMGGDYKFKGSSSAKERDNGRKKDDALITTLIDRLEERDRQLDSIHKQLESENKILREIAEVNEFEAIAKRICNHVETFIPDVKCSVLVNRKGKLYDLWSPSLTDSYKDLLKDGFPIGPGNGACGAAGYYQDMVVCDDIEEHENWTAFPEVQKEALKMGIRAVWSTPIIGVNDELLGTIAFYVERAGAPGSRCFGMLNWASNISRIAIERYNTERTLHEQNEMLRGILESQTDLIVYIAINGKILFCNNAYKLTFGITDEELENGIDFTQFIDPCDIESSKVYWEETKKPPFRTRHVQRCLTVHGPRYIEWEGWSLFDSYGIRYGLAGSGRDVTERIEAERRLLEIGGQSEKMAPALLESTTR